PRVLEREMPAITPFTIAVPEARLQDLQSRLANTALPSEIDAHGWGAGPTAAYVRAMLEHLKSGYDWRAAEAAINRHPQFTTEIDGQNIHFIHVKSKEANATPILLIHGWPGSIVEFLGVIDPL